MTAKKAAQCALDHFGLTGLGSGLAAAGANLLDTRGKFGGATPGTSVASKVAGNLLGDLKLPTRLPTLTGFPGIGNGLRVSFHCPKNVTKYGVLHGGRRASIDVGYGLMRRRACASLPKAQEEKRVANETGPLLNAIGAVLAKDTVYPLDGTFLHAEAEEQMVDMAIFKDLGDHLLYRDPMEGLAAALLDLWYAEPPKKRWSSMQYWISGDRFDASFTYAPLDPKVSSIDRCNAILKQSYGNKRIVYPSPIPTLSK